MGNEGEGRREAIFKDIRRYYCDYCGISRSKKALITAHVLAQHPEEVKKQQDCSEGEDCFEKSNTCESCGMSFRKPAHLKQHMLSHSLMNSKMREAPFLELDQYQAGDCLGSSIKFSLTTLDKRFERPFICPLKDCNSSFRRNDHLKRHVLQHEGKTFECPTEGCKSRFTTQGNMTRHLKEFHGEGLPRDETRKTTEHKCGEEGCGKVFKYSSRLRKHENSHVKLHCVEAMCTEPDCMKYFSNEKCLQAHIQSSHRYITCEKCGSRQLKQNIKRHMRSHESSDPSSPRRIECSFPECSLTFSTKSNLNQHIKAVHLETRRFKCSVPDCDMRFAFKHVRDKHEKSELHTYTS
ncbi:hypothetical protein M569_08782, partial [Genlisea aurea]